MWARHNVDTHLMSPGQVLQRALEDGGDLRSCPSTDYQTDRKAAATRRTIIHASSRLTPLLRVRSLQDGGPGATRKPANRLAVGCFQSGLTQAVRVRTEKPVMRIASSLTFPGSIGISILTNQGMGGALLNSHAISPL